MKSKKQKEAAMLYQQVIIVDVTEISVKYPCEYMQGGWGKDIFYLCFINGEKYFQRSGFGYQAESPIKMMLKRGIITSADYIYARPRIEGRRTTLSMMIKASAILKQRKYFEEYFGESLTSRVCEAINIASESAAKNTFDTDELKKSEDAYARRKELIPKKKELPRFLNQASTPIQDELQEKLNNTLENLVSQIEEMGWEVSLRRKHQQ